MRLTYDLFRIGHSVSPTHDQVNDRLFGYQWGDGYLVVPDGNGLVDRGVALAVALLRREAARGGLARASLSHGSASFSLHNSLYEMEGHADPHESGRYSMGQGILLTAGPIGTGLVRCKRLEEQYPRGPHLLIDADVLPHIENRHGLVQSSGTHLVNWVARHDPLADEIQQRAFGSAVSPEAVLAALREYQARFPTYGRLAEALALLAVDS